LFLDREKKTPFLLIDKPKGMTSHDVVDRVRKITGEKRVGHAGTLDPNASGLLIVGVGREQTKKLGTIAKDTNKTYQAEIYLGEEKTTDDVEGVTSNSSDFVPTRHDIDNVISKFEGEQMQTPPAYSAIKLKGKKAYELARKGKTVELVPRTVVIYSSKVIRYDYPVLEVEFEVSSGTYIRALARDIGRKLGTYGYLNNLRRTKIGKYDVRNAKYLDHLENDYGKSRI
jgi:tRNA pseudouridine55 synthase